MGVADDYARMPPRDKLAAARLKARKDRPYFASALLGLIPREMPGLGTLGVTSKMVLLWDPEAVNVWPLEELSAVLEHEVMHVLRDHAGRARRLGLVDEHGKATDPELAKIWNLAGDCEINDDLQTTHPHLFQGERAGVLPKSFKLKDGQLAETYYDEIRKLAKKVQKQQNGQGQGKGQGGQGDDQDGDGQGSGDDKDKGKLRAGRCGSCSGNPLDGEPQQGGGAGDQQQKPKAKGQQAKGNAEGSGDAEADGRSSTEVDRIRKQVAREIQDHVAKGRGTVPGGWVRWAEESLSPPKIRWQDKLARLTRAGVAWKAGQVDLRRDRISRRQWGIGIGPGRPLVGALRAPEPRVSLAIDTSGSMGEGELTTCLQEAQGVLAAVGAHVTLCTCDAAVHGLTKARSIQDVRSQLKGGGGTDFGPVFEALDRAPGGRPDLVIFATDGGGPAPAEPPPNMRVIWLLVGKHRMKPMSPRGGSIEWGEFVEVDE